MKTRICMIFGLSAVFLLGACTGSGKKGDDTNAKIKENQKDEVVEALGIKREALDLFDAATADLGKVPPDLSGAEEKLEKALATSPDFLEAQYNLGVVYENRGKYEEAIEAYRKAQEQDRLNTHTVKILLAIGRAQSLAGHLEDSIKSFEQVERLEPENIDILNSLAAATLKAEKLDESLAYIKRVLREDNENITALNTLGQIYMAKDNRSMAKYVFRKAIRVSIGAITTDEEAQAEPALLVLTDKAKNPKMNKGLTADLLNNLGLIYMREEEVPLAVVNFTAASKLDDKDVESRLNLGAIFLRYLNYDGAKEAFGVALKSAPGNCTAVLGMAASQFALGERDDSQAGYHAYLDNCDADSASAHLQLEKIYERKQDFPNAIKHCERYVALVKNPPKDDPMNADYCKALSNMATMSREDPMGGGEELPPEDGMEELPPEDGMEELPPDDGMEELPPEDGMEELPPEDDAAPADDAPAEEAPAEEAPADGEPKDGEEAEDAEKKDADAETKDAAPTKDADAPAEGAAPAEKGADAPAEGGDNG